MTSLLDQLQQDLSAAMKAGNDAEKSTLRMAITAIRNAAVPKPKNAPRQQIYIRKLAGATPKPLSVPSLPFSSGTCRPRSAVRNYRKLFPLRSQPQQQVGQRAARPWGKWSRPYGPRLGQGLMVQ
jgi:hypothetical protein